MTVGSTSTMFAGSRSMSASAKTTAAPRPSATISSTIRP